MQFDQLNRRACITLLSGAAAWPLAARAQQPTKVYRIGFVSVLSPTVCPVVRATRRIIRCN